MPVAGAYGAETWKHDHAKHGHAYEGDPCGPEESAPGAPHFTQGPHATDTANRLDPHVSAGIGEPTGSTNTGTSSGGGNGLGSATSGVGIDSPGTHDRHLGRDAALAGGAGAAGLGAYEASRDAPGSTTAGPHSSNLANKADPRVDSDLSGQRDPLSSGMGSGISGSGSATAGPHSSNLANKADPQVDSDLSRSRDTKTVGPASGVIGSSADGTALPSDTTPSQAGEDHHLGGDAGLAGAAGLGAYEAGKHGDPGSGPLATTSDPYSSADIDPRIDSAPHARTSGLGSDKQLASSKPDTSASTAPTSGAVPASDALYDSGEGPTTSGTSQTGTGHHLGRDAGLAGVGGVTAYEADKHLGGKNDRSSEMQPTDPSTSHHYGRDAAIGAGGASLAGTAYEADKQHRDPANTATTGTGAYDSREPTQSHHGRDAVVGAGSAGLAGTAYEAEKRHRDPTSTADSGAYDIREPTQSHSGRDAALAGGVGAGAGALAGEELSKKELEKEQKAHQKELAKEEKAHQKEIAKEEKAAEKAHQKEIAKEEKHHQKEVAAAEKKHEKEAAKAEKQHEKEVEKAEKQHEKEVAKEEKGEKKHHGGILGLFHR